MKKLKYLVPMIIILALPWTHKLVYQNFLMAWPNTSPGEAHQWAIGITCIVGAFTPLMLSL